MTTPGLRAAGALLVGIAASVGGVVTAQPQVSRRDPGPRAPDGPATKIQRQAYLMGTRAALATRTADRGQGLETLERMLRGLEAVEAELSTWREDTWLSTLNRQPVGMPQPAADSQCDLLEELRSWQQATGGAFDPTVGSLVAAWGLREGGRVPSADELARANGEAGLEHLDVGLWPCRVTRRRNVILDAGAFGKGAALDRVAQVEGAQGATPWMIDLGGQVAVGGRRDHGWPVAIAHPRQRTEAVLHLRLRTGSLATTGGSARDVEVGGRTIGHVLDPRTGQPVSRTASVTVWHPRALVADILSTALYVMGIDEGITWAEARGLAACFLVPGPAGSPAAVRATRAFRGRFLRGSAAGPAD